jgi:hypothetical protein
MPQSEKIAFVRMIVDGILGIKFVGGKPFKKNDTPPQRDLTRCFLEMQITESALLDLVEQGYSDEAKWSRPVAIALFYGAHKMCLSRINGYRAERGEEPLKL